jgi:hypothetical protein
MTTKSTKGGHKELQKSIRPVPGKFSYPIDANFPTVVFAFHPQVIENSQRTEWSGLCMTKDPLKMVESCAERMRLLVVWQSAMEVYSKAVTEQSRQVGMVSKAEFEGLSRTAEGARAHVLEAKEILKAHTSAHRCARGGEAVALHQDNHFALDKGDTSV